MGLEKVVHAVRRVPGRLAIIGHGPMELCLRELAAKLHVADRIVWMGHASQDELIGAYHAATALWFPSTHKSEAYGLVQVEAMASGCPVINTEIADSGVTWVSRHNESGLTVPVGSSAALAEAANLLLRDRELRDR